MKKDYIRIKINNYEEYIKVINMAEKRGYSFRNYRPVYNEKYKSILLDMETKNTTILLTNHNNEISVQQFEQMCIPKKQIIIYQKDNEVFAIKKENNKVVGSAKATCSPDDEFDFMTGAEIAFNRLSREKVKLQAGLAIWCKNLDEYNAATTKLSAKGYNSGNQTLLYLNVLGIVILVHEHTFELRDNPRAYEVDDEKLVDFDQVDFENSYSENSYSYYTGDIVCIHEVTASRTFTLGRIYHVENGMFKDDKGRLCGNRCKRYVSVKDINKALCCQFAEVVY